MYKTILSTIALALALGASGCANQTVGPMGFLYAKNRNPRSFDAGATTNLGVTAITGEACAMSILGLVAVGDWSVDAALRTAGAEGKTLKNIAVDHSIFNVLGFYQEFCTRVTAQVAQ